ncbi:MAG: chemotaxis protein CheW [Candidatus Hodarchaeales archaeon]|jgi:chemotaxis signal transduction protein
MISLDKHDSKSLKHAFLIVQFDSDDFAIPISQIEKIVEYTREIKKIYFNESFLDSLNNQSTLIPVLNLRKYLQCPKENFILTPQSRILFIKSNQIDFSVGVGCDAIRGVFLNVSELKFDPEEANLHSQHKCFKFDSVVKINTKNYPVLDLKKVINFQLVKSLQENNLSEKT